MKSKKQSGVFDCRDVSVVTEYLLRRPQAFRKLFIPKTALIEKSSSQSSRQIIKALNPPSDYLSKCLEGAPDCPLKVYVGGDLKAEIAWQVDDADSFLESLKTGPKEPLRVVMLDGITDTRNFGAIIRSAAFFGWNNIVFAKNRQAPVNDIVLHTSRGGLAAVSLYQTSSLARCVKELQGCQVKVVAADVAGGPGDGENADYRRCALILGAEDKGVRPSLLGLCDESIAIIPGPEQGVESLNVSVAAGVLFNQLSN